MTIDDLLELYVVEHVIPHLFVSNHLADREHAFIRARESMNDALSQGRPFVASDGFRALIVAVPGRPLMVTEHRTGKLIVPAEQDFMALLHSVW